MSRYRLIKEYPDSPELGSVVILRECGGYDKYQGYCLEENFNDKEPWGYDPDSVENYPEFWQPEDEWMSKLTNSPKGSFHWLNTNMGFVLRVGEYLHNKETLQQSESLWNWGEKVEEIAKETMEYFKDKLK